MPNVDFELQLEDRSTGQAIVTAGGMVGVFAAGLTERLSVVDPLAGNVALANPVPLTRGFRRFSVLSGAAAGNLVDLYVMGPEGDFTIIQSARPGNPSRVTIDRSDRIQMVKIPYSVTDM